MLVGRFSRLRTLDSADGEYVRQLRNLPAVMRCFQDRFFISDLAQKRFLEGLAESRARLYFVAESLAPVEPFGVLSLQAIDYLHQRAEAGIFLDERGQGQGPLVFDAWRLLLDYAFSTLNLQKIYGEVLAENERAIRLNRALGFELEGTLRRHVYFDRQFHDVLRFALFRDDFYDRPTAAMQLLNAAAGRPPDPQQPPIPAL
jgi:diamine N-acetyltransferase